MNFKTNLKRRASLAAMLGLALSVWVFPGTAWSGLREDMRDFDSFLRERPRVAADLRTNPDLVNSRRYLERHEDLARFIRTRPALREELRSNPGRVMAGPAAYDRRYGRSARYDRSPWWR